MMAMPTSDGKSGVDWWLSSGCGEDLQKELVEFGTGRQAGGMITSLLSNICDYIYIYIYTSL
jgi:hypothetical protein